MSLNYLDLWHFSPPQTGPPTPRISRCHFKRCFRGFPSQGCKFNKVQKAHFAAWKKGPENCQKLKVKLCPPLYRPLKHSMVKEFCFALLGKFNVPRIFCEKFLRPLFLEIKGRKSANLFAKISLRFSAVSAKYFARNSLSGISLKIIFVRNLKAINNSKNASTKGGGRKSSRGKPNGKKKKQKEKSMRKKCSAFFALSFCLCQNCFHQNLPYNCIWTVAGLMHIKFSKKESEPMSSYEFSWLFLSKPGCPTVGIFQVTLLIQEHLGVQV